MQGWASLRRRRAAPVRLKVAAMLALLTLGPMGLALGAPKTCTEVRVTIEGPLPPGWTAALDELCAAMPTWDEVDPTAQVRVSSKGSGVDVEVTLGDGRSARRHVAAPNVLRLTVEALVRLPPTPDPSVPVSATATTVPVASVVPAPTAPHPSPQPAHVTPPSSPFEGAVTMSGRVSAAPVYYAVGGVAQVSLHGGAWLFGLEAGWDVLQVLPSTSLPGFEMDSVSVGLFLGHRTKPSPKVFFDTAFTMLLVNDTQTIDTVAGELTGTATDVRLGGLWRGHLGGHALRPMLTFAVDVSPTRLRRAIRIADPLPRLPGVTLCLGLGVSFGEP